MTKNKYFATRHKLIKNKTVFLYGIYFQTIPGAELHISPGQIVHVECRKLYCRQAQRLPSSSTEGNPPLTSPKTRRSAEEKFDYKTKCLFCGTHAKLSKHHKRGYDVQPIQVRNLEFQNSIKTVCLSRGDEWGDIVLGRVEFANDLPAVDALVPSNLLLKF